VELSPLVQLAHTNTTLHQLSSERQILFTQQGQKWKSLPTECCRNKI